MSHWNWWVLFVAVSVAIFVAIGGFRMTKDTKTQIIVGVIVGVITLVVGFIGGWLIQGLSVKEHLIRVENKLDSFHNEQTALRNEFNSLKYLLLQDAIRLSERIDSLEGRPGAQTLELRNRLALLSYKDGFLLTNPEISFAKVWVGTARSSWTGNTLTLQGPWRNEVRIVATAALPESWRVIKPGDMVLVVGTVRADGSLQPERLDFQPIQH